jgi:hypothetical protein
MSVASDNPICRPEDDALGRAAVARSFVRQVLSLDAPEGMVVGVLGAWGSGKTSFVNLARAGFAEADVPVLDFNPWMFSGAEQLVDSFFIELVAQLKLRPGLAGVANDLADFGEAFSGLAWLPMVGPWIDRGRGAAKLLSRILQRRMEGTTDRRDRLKTALAALDYPILVVLDDIDRLSSPEIREIFKLVRLTASFPNIIYVVAFDRLRVEQALSEQGVPGRDYLEKILQVAVDLPTVPPESLTRQIFTAINSALDGIPEPGSFDDEVWPDLFMEVIRPLLRNMRDVRRYAAAIHGTVEALGGQIALADVLTLEAMRVFLPDVFAQLGVSVEGLTTPSGQSVGSGDPPELKAEIDALMAVAGDRAEIVRAMIQRLFPAGQRHLGGSFFGSSWSKTWLRDRRVAHEQILRLYLERVAGEQLLAFTDAERAWAVMADRDGFQTYMESLDQDRREDVIAALETYEDQYRPEHVVPATTVLLNLLPNLPDKPRGMLSLDTQLVVGRVTLRLVRSLSDAAAVETAVREILPNVTSLSSKFELITDLGYREGAGHKLVTESAAKEFEAEWRAEARAASIADLIAESNLLRVLLFARHDLEKDEPPLEIADSPEMTLAVLRAAKSEVRGQTIGNRAVRRTWYLAWDALVDLYGGEETLLAHIDALKAAGPDGESDLLELAERYLGGWRPKDLA